MVLRGETKEAHSQGRLGLGEREDQGVDWVVGGAGGVEGCGGGGGSTGILLQLVRFLNQHSFLSVPAPVC